MPVAQINKSLVRRRFCRSLISYDDNAVVQRELAADLCRHVAEQLGRGAALGRVLELGCGTGLLTRALLDGFTMRCWAGNDIVCAFDGLADAVREAGVPEVQSVPGDMESCEFSPGWDLIVANASFQWLEHPVAFAAGLRHLLLPGGLIAFTTFGPGNLSELSEITGRGLTYATVAEYTDGLSPYFEVVASQSWCRCVEFLSPHDVLRHIKATGTNAIAPLHWSRGDLDAFSARYRDRFQTADGRVGLTYHPMLIVARLRGVEE